MCFSLSYHGSPPHFEFSFCPCKYDVWLYTMASHVFLLLYLTPSSLFLLHLSFAHLLLLPHLFHPPFFSTLNSFSRIPTSRHSHLRTKDKTMEIKAAVTFKQDRSTMYEKRPKVLI